MPSAILDVRPAWAVPGGRVTLAGDALPLGADGPPRVTVGGTAAHVLAASRRRVTFAVPPTSGGGTQAIEIEGLSGVAASLRVATTVITGIHQVDNPIFDRSGRLYVTHSGSRGNRADTPLQRIAADGIRESLPADIGNPTSMAVGPSGGVFISNRFDGQVYRLGAADHLEVWARELGVPTGLAVGPDGSLFVGDRSGSILRVAPDRQVETFASLPASVAAFHLAFGPDGALFVAAPTLASRDVIYRIGADRLVDSLDVRFGRPQGLAFDAGGRLYVADALAGAAGLYRVDLADRSPEPELLVAAPALVGLAFDPAGGLVLASNDTVWRLDVPLHPPGARTPAA